VQIALFRALGAEPPVFGHHNLLTTSSGEGLSKRSGALSVESLREAGVEPMAIASLAVLIGTSENVQAIDSLAELATHFDPASTSKSAAKFDPDELFVLNRALLHRMPFEEVRDRLVLFGIADERAEAFWNAVRGNLDKIADARDWWRIVNEGPLEAQQFDAETLEFLRSGFALLPEEPWGDTVWKQWTGAIRKETGRKGKELFAPLRLALTGRSSGPELAELLPIIGREGTLARRP
jgi:glutamyl-tRNA synthetase